MLLERTKMRLQAESTEIRHGYQHTYYIWSSSITSPRPPRWHICFESAFETSNFGLGLFCSNNLHVELRITSRNHCIKMIDSNRPKIQIIDSNRPKIQTKQKFPLKCSQSSIY